MALTPASPTLTHDERSSSSSVGAHALAPSTQSVSSSTAGPMWLRSIDVSDAALAKSSHSPLELRDEHELKSMVLRRGQLRAMAMSALSDIVRHASRSDEIN